MQHVSKEMQACIDECMGCYKVCLGMAMTHCLERRRISHPATRPSIGGYVIEGHLPAEAIKRCRYRSHMARRRR
jgi:hypothetical protein